MVGNISAAHVMEVKKHREKISKMHQVQEVSENALANHGGDIGQDKGNDSFEALIEAAKRVSGRLYMHRIEANIFFCSMKSAPTSATKKLKRLSEASRHPNCIRLFVSTESEPPQEELVKRALAKNDIPDTHTGEILMADAILERARDRIRLFCCRGFT